jgi:hypothetical protein
MPVLYRVLRLMLVSAACAAVVAGALFAVQMLIWWKVPPISVVSIAYACAPHHAIRMSACLFALVFGFAFLVGVPENVVRPMLFGEEELPSSGRQSGEK